MFITIILVCVVALILVEVVLARKQSCCPHCKRPY